MRGLKKHTAWSWLGTALGSYSPTCFWGASVMDFPPSKDQPAGKTREPIRQLTWQPGLKARDRAGTLGVTEDPGTPAGPSGCSRLPSGVPAAPTSQDGPPASAGLTLELQGTHACACRWGARSEKGGPPMPTLQFPLPKNTYLHLHMQHTHVYIHSYVHKHALQPTAGFWSLAGPPDGVISSSCHLLMEPQPGRDR